MSFSTYPTATLAGWCEGIPDVCSGQRDLCRELTTLDGGFERPEVRELRVRAPRARDRREGRWMVWL
jgi:hypothetical protein